MYYQSQRDRPHLIDQDTLDAMRRQYPLHYLAAQAALGDGRWKIIKDNATSLTLGR